MSSIPQPADATVEDLRQRCALLEQQNAELTAKLHWFEEQFQLARHRQFGASSERFVPEQQSLLFNEAEVEASATPAAPEPTVETITYRRRKARGRREAMLRELPVETIEHRLPESEQVCSSCGGPLHEMSTEVRQELAIVPAQAKVGLDPLSWTTVHLGCKVQKGWSQWRRIILRIPLSSELEPLN